MNRDKLIFERGAPGRRCVAFPAAVDSGTEIPETMRRDIPPVSPKSANWNSCATTPRFHR